MCGIVGIVGDYVNARGDDAAAKLQHGLQAIARRGPDGEGTWTHDRVMFGHVRLAIVDPDPRSNQPMESDNWTLCYNGEGYNFREIRKTLEGLGHTFVTQSDTEVLLLSLEQWGIEGCLSRIAGMFAFLAHNKATGQTYAARDHMGIKPLLYARDASGTLFLGSSITSIQKMCPDANFTINKTALASYFSLGGVHGSHTCFDGIERLDPAHYMEILPNGDLNIHKYWEPQYQSNFTMVDLIAIVREYQISDVQSALFLSGGVDSSFLACVYDDLDCFHLTSPEEPYAQMVADRFGRKLISVKPDLETYEADVEAATAFHGEPMMSVGIPLAVSREVNKHGYKMAISANGADELFLGYSRTPMPEYTPDYMPLHETPSKQFMVEQLQHIFRDDRNFEMPALRDVFPSMRDIYTQSLAEHRLEGFSVSASHRWVELMTYVLSDLNPTLDAASMYNSVEVRVPFLDHRIVQGVLSWDASVLVTPELGRKAPLKEHIAKYFPQTLYQRTKLGFSIHSEKLDDISKLSETALKQALKTKTIELQGGTQFGEYERDMIYLGNSLFGFSKWADANCLNTEH